MFRPNITLSVSYNKGIYHLYITMQTLQIFFLYIMFLHFCLINKMQILDGKKRRGKSLNSQESFQTPEKSYIGQYLIQREGPSPFIGPLASIADPPSFSEMTSTSLLHYSALLNTSLNFLLVVVASSAYNSDFSDVTQQSLISQRSSPLVISSAPGLMIVAFKFHFHV